MSRISLSLTFCVCILLLYSCYYFSLTTQNERVISENRCSGNHLSLFTLLSIASHSNFIYVKFLSHERKGKQEREGEREKLFI